MMIKRIIQEEKERLEKDIPRLEERLTHAPEGSLMVFRSGEKLKLYRRKSEDGIEKRVFLKKTDRKLAEKLAWKAYCIRRLADEKEELEAIEAFQKVFLRSPFRGKYLLSDRMDSLLKNRDFMDLLGKEDLMAWAREPYEKLNEFSNNLVHTGSDGENTRSKSEEIIKEVLIKYNIPYHYDAKLDLAGNIVYADFIIRHPVTGEVYIWEHLGRMDEERYRRDAQDKLNKYLRAGYTPMLDLIITSETAKHPMSFYEAEAIVRHFFLS